MNAWISFFTILGVATGILLISSVVIWVITFILTLKHTVEEVDDLKIRLASLTVEEVDDLKIRLASLEEVRNENTGREGY